MRSTPVFIDCSRRLVVADDADSGAVLEVRMATTVQVEVALDLTPILA